MKDSLKAGKLEKKLKKAGPVAAPPLEAPPLEVHTAVAPHEGSVRSRTSADRKGNMIMEKDMVCVVVDRNVETCGWSGLVVKFLHGDEVLVNFSGVLKQVPTEDVVKVSENLENDFRKVEKMKPLRALMHNHKLEILNACSTKPGELLLSRWDLLCRYHAGLAKNKFEHRMEAPMLEIYVALMRWSWPDVTTDFKVLEPTHTMEYRKPKQFNHSLKPTHQNPRAI